jgi:acyl-CoA synthetase (NDP forming)
VLQQIVRTAARWGVRFTKAISYGNAIDLNECDYLEYFTNDPDTKVILMYIEGLKDGRRFIRALRKATETKPVVIMKGGRSNAGGRAAASHTASLAGSYSTFQSLVHAAGGVTVRDFDELVDMAVAFNFLPSDTSRDLGVQGGSGGGSVNAADLLEEAGLNLVPIPQDIRDQLKAEGISEHDWFNNPIDGSISMGDSSPTARLTELMLEHDNFKTFVASTPGGMGPGGPPKGGGAGRGHGKGANFDVDIEAILEHSLHRKTNKPVIMLGGDMPRMAGMEEMANAFAQIRERIIKEGVATFPTMTRAANALGKLTDFYDYRRELAEYS